MIITICIAVALRKESVDRNLMLFLSGCLGFLVALRKESVDRNISFAGLIWIDTRSLSARRAWIEITAHTAKKTSIAGSLSARRAWIEISMLCSVAKL